MAVDLITAGSGLMRKLARIGKQMSLFRTYANTTNPKDSGAFDTLMDQFAADRSRGPNLVNIHLRHRASMVATLEEYRQEAREALMDQVMAEASNPPGVRDLRLCLEAVFDEMRGSGDDVNAQAVSLGASGTPLSPANTGNGSVVWSITRPDGQTAETAFDETLLIRCTRDSYSGYMGKGGNPSRPGSEEFTIRGFPGVPSTLDPDFANANFGSGANAILMSCNPRIPNALGNTLVNGDMESWTGATPNNWSKTDASSQISQTTTSGEYHDGSSGLKIAGHASGTPEWWQEFNLASGSPYVMKPLTNYALSFYGKVLAGAPASGVLTASLADSSNAALTSRYDSNGFSASPTSQSTTFALTGWTTSFVNKTATFRLQKNLSTVRLHFKMSTLLSAGTNAFIDRIALTEMTPAIPGVGPWGAAFSGLTNWTYGDNFSRAINGATDMDTFQILMYRLFPEMAAWDLMPPSDSGGLETVLDSLITAA